MYSNMKRLIVNLHSGRVSPPPYIIMQNQKKSNTVPIRYDNGGIFNDCKQVTMVFEYEEINELLR